MKYSIELGPVECRIGSFYEYEISEDEAKRIHAAVMAWYHSLSKPKRKFVKAIDVYPQFVRSRGAYANQYITIKTTCTAGTLEDPPEGMMVPEGTDKGWELAFLHHCLPDENLDSYLEKFSELANMELPVAISTFKNVKPRVSVIWREQIEK